MWRLAIATSIMLIGACTQNRALTQRDTAAGKLSGTAVPSQTAQPAAAATAQVATSADGAVNTDLLKQGYHTGKHNGELVYCRTEQTTGTRFRSQVCLTERQIIEEQRLAREALTVPPEH